MAGFDPDAYLAKGDKPKGFDPDAYLAKKPDDETRAIRKALKLPNPADFPASVAAAQKFVEGATFGAADEIHGFTQARDLVGKKLLGGELPSAGDVSGEYKRARDAWRAGSAANAKVHPGVSSGAEIAGGVVGGGALGKGAGALGAGARRAALEGAASGFWSSEANSPIGLAEDTGKGALVGAVLDKAVKVAAPTSREVKDYAAEKAVKAAGAMTKQFRELRNKGLLRQQGEWLLENRVVTPLASLEDVAEKSGALREKAGVTIGAVVDNVDSLRKQAVKLADDLVEQNLAHVAPADRAAARMALKEQIEREFGYNFQNVADGIREMAKRDEKIGAAAFHRAKLDYLADVFDNIAKSGPGTLREGLQNKTQQRRLLKDVDSLGEEYKQEIYDIISRELDRSVGNTERLAEGVAKMAGDAGRAGGRAAAPAGRAALPEAAPKLPPAGAGGELAIRPPAGAPDVPLAARTPREGAFGQLQGETDDALSRFKQANRDYAAAATAQKTADSRLGTVMANRDYGLTTAIATNAGLLAGGAPGAVAMGALNNAARKYGSSVQATFAWKLGNLLEKQPEAFGKYAPQLREAMRRGTQQFLIANEVVAKDDPQYAQFLEQMIQQEAGANARGDAIQRRMQGSK